MKPPCDEGVIIAGRGSAPHTAAVSWILTATILGSSMAFIDSTVVNVALPALQANFHATVTDVQWVVESYGLFLAALILAGGSLGDLFGRRLTFLIGVSIFAAASAACGASLNIQQLVAARSVQGVGAALLVPGSLSIISASFDEKTRGAAIGTWSGFTAITTAIGPVLGGWLVQHASWRWVFFINIPLAAAVLAISLWKIPESKSTNAGRMDWAGALLATAALGGLVGGLIESVNLGWSNPVVIGVLLAGLACSIAFVLIEARVASPMLPLSLFRSRSFAGANLLTLSLYAAIGVFFFLFPLDLIQAQGYSATAAGASMLPLILLIFFLSRWSGGLVARYGPRAPLTIGPVIAAAGFALFALPSIAGDYWKSFFPAVIVLGLGLAFTVAPLTTVVMNAVTQDRAGGASGVNNAVARLAGVLAIAVLGIVMVQAFASRLNHDLAPLTLPVNVLRALHANQTKLAALPVPPGLDPSLANIVRHSIADSFICGFRVVMLSCAALSLASAVIARLMITDKMITDKAS
jgi:EmrB/QacA subfamily drug resistance transporter